MLICIQAIQNDADHTMVEELYHQHYSTMLYIAQGILKDRYRAEDAVSQAFIKIIDNLQKFSFENCNKTKGLIVIIVRNICYDILKADKRHNLVELEEAEGVSQSSEDAPLERLLSEENNKALIALLSDLNEKSGSVLKLKYLYGYSDGEIAKMLDITPENVRVRFYRAKKVLMEEIKKRGSENE